MRSYWCTMYLGWEDHLFTLKEIHRFEELKVNGHKIAVYQKPKYVPQYVPKLWYILVMYQKY